MKIQKNIWVFVMVGLFVPFQLVYADQCDDIFDKADGIFESAKEAVNQKNYDRAAGKKGDGHKYISNLTRCGVGC